MIFKTLSYSLTLSVILILFPLLAVHSRSISTARTECKVKTTSKPERCWVVHKVWRCFGSRGLKLSFFSFHLLRCSYTCRCLCRNNYCIVLCMLSILKTHWQLSAKEVFSSSFFYHLWSFLSFPRYLFVLDIYRAWGEF